MENESEDMPVPDILKAITIRDCVYWIASAWDEASSESLHKAWKNLLPESMSDEDGLEDVCANPSNADCIESAAALGTDAQDAVAEWMEADMDEPGYQVPDDDEIVAEILNTGKLIMKKLLMKKLLKVD